VGYSIYWGKYETDVIEKCYSVFHLLCGQLLMGFALAAFARMLIGSKANWYLEALQLRDLEEKRSNQTKVENLLDNINHYMNKVKPAFFFSLWLTFGVVWSCKTVDWSVMNGFYFAVTSMSTAGIWPLPQDATDEMLFIAAVFTCTGAPMMMITFGIFAQIVYELSSTNALLQELNRPLTYLELEFMQFEVIEDADGYIDASEFTLLMLVRLKALNPELISTIIERLDII
jgi:hypothetical protein